MLWIYDEAIVNDLSNCIDPEGAANSTVRMMGDEGMMGIFAQLQEDRITFPALYLSRNSETPLDKSRYNFTRLHKGVASVFDPKTNNIYLEKAAPIELSYELHALTTNTVDQDEIIRELLFRYSSMYYITTEIPYESKRKIRFGVAINPDNPIQRKSSNSDYIQTGKLYESILTLQCQGAVMIDYTARHLEGLIMDDTVHVK